MSIDIYAQVALKNQVYVFDDFSGGLNLKKSPFSLPKKQGTICENIRFNTELGSISKRDEIFSYGSADASEAITGMHRLYLKNGTKKLIVTHGNEIEVGDDDLGTFTTILDLTTSDYKWQFVTWHNLAIGTDGYNQPVKTDGTDATYLGSCFAEDNGAGAGPDGVYLYKISFYTSSYEVLFNVPSNSVTVVDNDIDLKMIPIAPDTYGGEDVTGRKVYRTSAGGADYKLLTNGTIADNTTVILTDSDADGARGVAYPGGDDTFTPPKGKLILVHNNRLFIALDPNNPSRIYYSDDGSHDVFVTDSYFNIRPNDGDEITFIKNQLGILTIGKNNTIQKLYTRGSDPAADWEITDPFSHIGCVAPYTAENSPIGIIYLAYDGLYKFNGQYSTLISEAVTPVIKDISESNFVNCWSKLHQNIYYMAYTSKATGASVNDRVLLFDLLGDSYSIDLLSFNAFCAFNSGSDWGTLYSGSSADGNVYAHTETAYEVIHSRHSDFTGTWDDARYIPTSVGGDDDDPVIEIAWTITIDGASGTIDSHSYGATAIIDRPDTTGGYISQVLEIGSTTFSKLYWNETIPIAGGNVLFYIRSDTTDAACQAASWSSAFAIPSGSDISGETAKGFVQYKVAFSTTDIAYTPTLYKANNYVVKLTYDVEGTTDETSIPLHWRGGWTDLKYPGYVKSLKKIYCYLDSPEETGTLTLTFENFEGDTDTFDIDLNTNPEYYSEYFTNGKFIGEQFRLDITEDSLNDIQIKKIIVIYDVEPLV